MGRPGLVPGLAAAFVAGSCASGDAPAATPDWTGVWVVAGSDMDRQDGSSVGVGPSQSRGGAGAGPRPPPPTFKGEYKDRADARRAASAKAAAEGAPLPFQADDGCRPGALDSGFWAGPYAFEIVTAPRQVVIFQEFLEQVRRIYLDGRPHPDLADYDFTFKGHSVGRWDGDELVVDTVGIRVDDATYGRKTQVSERIWSPRPDYLQVRATTVDPEALAGPWTVEYMLHRKPKLEIQDFYCGENNRNPTDGEGRTRTILAPPVR